MRVTFYSIQQFSHVVFLCSGGAVQYIWILGTDARNWRARGDISIGEHLTCNGVRGMAANKKWKFFRKLAARVNLSNIHIKRWIPCLKCLTRVLSWIKRPHVSRPRWATLDWEVGNVEKAVEKNAISATIHAFTDNVKNHIRRQHTEYRKCFVSVIILLSAFMGCICFQIFVRWLIQTPRLYNIDK